jgi:hypothetical protein
MKHKPDHIPQEAWDAVGSPELDSSFIAGMKPSVRVYDRQRKQNHPPKQR